MGVWVLGFVYNYLRSYYAILKNDIFVVVCVVNLRYVRVYSVVKVTKVSTDLCLWKSKFRRCVVRAAYGRATSGVFELSRVVFVFRLYTVVQWRVKFCLKQTQCYSAIIAEWNCVKFSPNIFGFIVTNRL